MAYDELNCCKLPIKIRWLCPKSIADIKCDQKPDDVKKYIEGAFKYSLVAKHTFNMAPYVEE